MNAIDHIKKLAFGVSEREATFEVRGFDCPDPSLKSHLEKIGSSFLVGYHHTLFSKHQNELTALLESIPIMYKGFSYEGAAMALTLLDNLIPFGTNRLNPFMQGDGEKHIYMMHVGAGWAFARLPANIDKAIRNFDPVYKWLAVDGYGFHQAYFKTNKYVHDCHIPKQLNGYTPHAYCQGIGRALWFVGGGQPAVISTMISKFPSSYHSDLWSGVGLACTYAGSVDHSIIEALKLRSKDHAIHLGQGSVFAAAARMKAGCMVPHTELSTLILTGTDVHEAAKIANKTHVDLKQEGALPAFEIWRHRIREALQTIHHKRKQKSNSDEKIYY